MRYLNHGILTLKKGLKPLEKIKDTIKRISQGDLQAHVEIIDASDNHNELALLNSDIHVLQILPKMQQVKHKMSIE